MRKRLLFITTLLVMTYTVISQNVLYPKTKANQLLKISEWKGITQKEEGGVLQLMDKAVYRVKEGTKIWYSRGLMREYDGVIDARQWYGIRFEINLESDELFDGKLTIKIPGQPKRHDLPDSTNADFLLKRKGWHAVTVPFSRFDLNKGQFYFYKFLKQIILSGKYSGISGGEIGLRNIELVKGNPIYLEAEVRSKPGEANEVVQYDALVGNSSDKVQVVSLSFSKDGWEGMLASVLPAIVSLQPGEEKQIKIAVIVPDKTVPGVQEQQHLVASVNEDNASSTSLDFITLRKLTHPYLVHTEDGWQAVIAKTKKYDWADKSLKEYIRKADEFEVPSTPQGNLKTTEGTPAVYKSYLEQRFWPVAIAYKLTGEKKYAEKLALLLCRLSAPGAFPTTLHANSQGIPQEGGFWEGVARSYDLIKDAGVLSSKDKELIEQSMRLYIYTIEDAMGDGGISNWSVFNLCPAAQCALAIQDMYHFNYLMEGPCGITDHIRYGIMDDGWWYEMSLSYNLGCAENMTALGIAARPFGIDLLNKKFPVAVTQNVGLRPFEYENFQGMAFGKFGPVTNNYIDIKRMWDGILAYPDYRGVMFGMGDGHESEVGGGAFELAYYAFRDTAYASVIKQGGRRDLVNGVPELPKNTPLLYSLSTHSDNAGIAVLRSQTDGREQKDQIQAALKYGTHGGYHGHFDRISLVSLMRYGRSFWNPETSWFGYGSYMYKWWVQPSMSHNMVVVDGKMQEPVESRPLLFHSGKMMQVMGAETNARWSNPPYFGGYDQLAKVRNGEAPYVFIPANHPQPTDITDYTEPVLQRRLLIVTDDYVVTADYLKGSKEHTFDNLLHLRGAKADASLNPVSKSEQFDKSPLSSGQFITNVTDYAVNGIGKVISILNAEPGQSWESGGFNGYQEPGKLNIDVYNVWPLKTTLRIGNYAEAYSNNKKLVYEVRGDDKVLVKDSIGTWLLGRGDINVSVKNMKTLQLTTLKSKGAKNNTLFWGGAKIITSKGKEIPLTQLKTSSTNIIPSVAVDKDYKGGPIRIAGITYSESLAAEPLNETVAGIITLDMSGLDAVRFVAGIGGDCPVGDESQVRKTVSFRSNGKEATFLTIIEPYEANKMIRNVKALDANTIEVELNDGRSQRIKIEGFNTLESKPAVSIQEIVNDKVVREEKTSGK